MDYQKRQQAIKDHRSGRDFVDLGEPSGPSPSRRVVYVNDLDTTWSYLRPWLENYAKSTAPIGVTDCVFKPLSGFPRLDGRSFEFAIVGTNQAATAFPLVELAISASLERCSLRLRYNASEYVGYFRSLLLAIAVQWPETKREIERVVSQLPQAASAISVAAVTPETEAQAVSRGQAWARGKVSDEIRERANRARVLHSEHSEWSTQEVADHLMETLTDDELSKLKRGVNRKSSPLMGEDIENAWYRMGEIEGSEKWPKWSTGKNSLR